MAKTAKIYLVGGDTPLIPDLSEDNAIQLAEDFMTYHTYAGEDDVSPKSGGAYDLASGISGEYFAVNFKTVACVEISSS